MAACSSPYCQKDPVSACTAESKALLSAISKHINAGDASDCDFVLMQVSKYKAAQRAAIMAYNGAQFFGVSFVASMVGNSLTKYIASFSSVLSLSPLVFLGTLGTTVAVVRFVHKATMKFSLFARPIRSASSRHWWNR